MKKIFIIFFSIAMLISCGESNTEGTSSNGEISKYNQLAASLYIGKYAAVDSLIPKEDLREIIYLTCKAFLLGDQSYDKASILHSLITRDFIVFKGNIMPSSDVDTNNIISVCKYYENNENLSNNINYLENIKDKSIILPNGWRYPTNEELLDEPLRKKSATGNTKVTADFNNDGVIDTALLLMKEKGYGNILAIYLSNIKGGFNWYLLNESTDDKKYQFYYGIDLVEPQKGIETACGKGYWECRKDETPKIDINSPAIYFFYFEKGGSLVYWLKSEKSFKTIPLSD